MVVDLYFGLVACLPNTGLCNNSSVGAGRGNSACMWVGASLCCSVTRQRGQSTYAERLFPVILCEHGEGTQDPGSIAGMSA